MQFYYCFMCSTTTINVLVPSILHCTLLHCTPSCINIFMVGQCYSNHNLVELKQCFCLGMNTCGDVELCDEDDHKVITTIFFVILCASSFLLKNKKSFSWCTFTILYSLEIYVFELLSSPVNKQTNNPPLYPVVKLQMGTMWINSPDWLIKKNN